jgi:hypothetical protein
LIYAASAYQNWNLWPCQDDPITVWASLWPLSWGEVAERSVFTLHLPTYFWMARASAALFGGGLEGIRIGSVVLGLAAVLATFYALRWIAPRSYIAVGAASVVGTMPNFANFYSCARPYSWLPLLFVLALSGSVLVARRRIALGLWLTTSTAGLAAQLSAVVIPSACVLVAAVAWQAWKKGARLGIWMIFLGIAAAGFGPAVYKAVWLALQFSAPSARYEPWLLGSPMIFPAIHVALIASLLAITLLARRRGWCEVPAPELGNRWLWAAAGLAFVLPVVNVAAGLEINAPWYWAFEGVIGSLFLCLPLATVAGHLRTRIFVTGLSLLLMSFPLGTRYIVLPQVSDFRWDLNHDIYSYLTDHARPDDLVVVVSLWPSAYVSAMYDDRRSRELLLSETLLYPGMEKLRLLPAPPAPQASPDPRTPYRFWRRVLDDETREDPRIWFIDKPSLKRFWLPNEASAGRIVLGEANYRAVDPELSERFGGRLVRFERMSMSEVRDAGHGSVTARGGRP